MHGYPAESELPNLPDPRSVSRLAVGRVAAGHNRLQLGDVTGDAVKEPHVPAGAGHPHRSVAESTIVKGAGRGN